MSKNQLKCVAKPTIHLFNTDPATLSTFSGTPTIHLTIGVPYELLLTLVTTLDWLQSNLLAHIPANQIRYIAVGNEVFLKNLYYTPHILLAILKLQQALQTLGLDISIKLSFPLSTFSPPHTIHPQPPSIDPYVQPSLLHLLCFLRDTNSPFMVNSYPYFINYVCLDYVLFGATNEVVSDGSWCIVIFSTLRVDEFVSAMEREGVVGVPVVVSEKGWLTGGGKAASAENARAYDAEVVRQLPINHREILFKPCNLISMPIVFMKKKIIFQFCPK